MKHRLFALAIPVVVAAAAGSWPAAAGTPPGIGNIPQGTQSDSAYAASVAGVTNVFATTQRTSCYRPEVAYFGTYSPENDGYSGMSPCNGAANTGENIGTTPYATQAGSNPGYPAASPMLVKDHSESDIRIDPNNPLHLIGTSKWLVSPEGYNHLLGFFESWDGGQTWPVQGHIPGYEGWTDNTDPVGAFDTYSNFYAINLPYQFFYKGDSHDFQTGSAEPNPTLPNDVISMSVRKAGSTTAADNTWIVTHKNQPDYIAVYDSNSLGNGPDKEWVTIDTNKTLPNGQPNPKVNTIYAMWVDFHSPTPVPWVSTATALPDGTHTDWSAPVKLPSPPHNPQGVTYLLPHVDANGVVYTTLTNFNPKKGYCCVQIFVDKSADAGKTWSVAGIVGSTIQPPPLEYANTQLRDGIENSFTVGAVPIKGVYPLYVSYEDYSAGVDNVILTASYDGGTSWNQNTFVQVNDNASQVDAFQPNLTASSKGTISVAFYDRRLNCPSGGGEARKAGIALDTVNLNYSGSLPPYGASNYCVNSTIQFYKEDLTPLGHNIRTSQHTWDPQLNEPRPAGLNGVEGFIGDYYGNIISADGSTDYTTSVSTYNDGTNPSNQQQQVVATISIP
ncbi:MAG: hypothetical protein E6I88_11580 [Chloroflexi bacterium]|nr:MAG: hypothetical protein E6I88_11580 [Chloroflexota bacterium]